MKIAMREVAGDLKSRQFEFDAQNEQQAAEMFSKALAEFDMTKLTKVEILGKPEITREGSIAGSASRSRSRPIRSNGSSWHTTSCAILTKTATRRATISLAGGVKHSAEICLARKTREVRG